MTKNVVKVELVGLIQYLCLSNLTKIVSCWCDVSILLFNAFNHSYCNLLILWTPEPQQVFHFTLEHLGSNHVKIHHLHLISLIIPQTKKVHFVKYFTIQSAAESKKC